MVELSRRFIVEPSGEVALVADTTVPPDGQRLFDIADAGTAGAHVVNSWCALSPHVDLKTCPRKRCHPMIMVRTCAVRPAAHNRT
jgi:hypothetical protein